MPTMPTLPATQGWAATVSMTSYPSTLWTGSKVMNAPPEQPVPRTFTPTYAKPRLLKSWANVVFAGLLGSYPEYSTTVGNGPGPPGSDTSAESVVPSRVVM